MADKTVRLKANRNRIFEDLLAHQAFTQILMNYEAQEEIFHINEDEPFSVEPWRRELFPINDLWVNDRLVFVQVIPGASPYLALDKWLTDTVKPDLYVGVSLHFETDPMEVKFLGYLSRGRLEEVAQTVHQNLFYRVLVKELEAFDHIFEALQEPFKKQERTVSTSEAIAEQVVPLLQDPDFLATSLIVAPSHIRQHLFCNAANAQAYLKNMEIRERLIETRKELEREGTLSLGASAEEVGAAILEYVEKQSVQPESLEATSSAELDLEQLTNKRTELEREGMLAAQAWIVLTLSLPVITHIARTTSRQFRFASSETSLEFIEGILMDSNRQPVGEKLKFWVISGPEVDSEGRFTFSLLMDPSADVNYVGCEVRVFLLNQEGATHMVQTSVQEDHSIRIKNYKLPHGFVFTEVSLAIIKRT